MAVYVDQRTQTRERGAKIIGSLPPFSPILNQLIGDLGKETVSYGKLADLIEKDTVIAGNVLRLVNSGLYGRRSTISSVRSAISVLGINKLRNMVLGMSVSRLWNQTKMGKDFSPARFNLHGLATAILADQLAMNLDVDFPEGAFLAGLFHDLGKMLIAVGMQEEYGEIMSQHGQGVKSLRECEQDVLGLSHEELSAVAVATWNLPPPIQTAVLFHHRPETPTAMGAIPLSRVIAAANEHANSAGRSVVKVLNESDRSPQYSIDVLPLEPELRERILQDFTVEFDAVSSYF